MQSEHEEVSIRARVRGRCDETSAHAHMMQVDVQRKRIETSARMIVAMSDAFESLPPRRAVRNWMIDCETFLPNGRLMIRHTMPSVIIIQNRMWLINIVETVGELTCACIGA